MTNNETTDNGQRTTDNGQIYMLKKFYVIFGVGVILFYSTAAFLGWELFTPSRNQLPPDQRGNYRGFHFWHTGFRGGK